MEHLSDIDIDIFLTNLCDSVNKYEKKILYINPLVVDVCISRTRKRKVTEDTSELISFLNKRLKESIDNYVTTIIIINGPSLVNNGGNNHWSLLVYHKSINAFCHYDTLIESRRVNKGANIEKALYFSKILTLLFLKDKSDTTFCESEYYIKQESDWECGYYCLMTASIIVKFKDTLISKESNETYKEMYDIPYLKKIKLIIKNKTLNK